MHQDNGDHEIVIICLAHSGGCTIRGNPRCTIHTSAVCDGGPRRGSGSQAAISGRSIVRIIPKPFTARHGRQADRSAVKCELSPPASTRHYALTAVSLPHCCAAHGGLRAESALVRSWSEANGHLQNNHYHRRSFFRPDVPSADDHLAVSFIVPSRVTLILSASVCFSMLRNRPRRLSRPTLLPSPRPCRSAPFWLFTLSLTPHPHNPPSQGELG